MTNLLSGMASAFEIFLTVMLVTEANQFIETRIISRQAQRIGFRLFFSRLVRSQLRGELDVKQRLGLLISALPFYFSLGLIPQWLTGAAFDLEESLLIFVFAMTALPTFHIFQMKPKLPGFGERIQERAVASLGFIFLLTINLFVSTGESSILKLVSLQKTKTWLIFDKPLTILIFIGILVAVYNMTEQYVFRTTQHGKVGETYQFALQKWKTGWLIFLSCLFLGGAGPWLPLTAVVLNTLAMVTCSLFTRLKEEQTEGLILWELGPVTVFILLLTLAYLGSQ